MIEEKHLAVALAFGMSADGLVCRPAHSIKEEVWKHLRRLGLVDWECRTTIEGAHKLEELLR